MEKYYKFVDARIPNPEFGLLWVDIMRLVTLGTRWDLYPFRMNKELDETDERKELIKKERFAIFNKLFKIILSVVAFYIFYKIGVKGTFGDILAYAIVGYIAYQLLLIPLALIAPRVVVAFKEGEYPYLWISTWLHIIGSSVMILAFFVLILTFLSTIETLFKFGVNRAVLEAFVGIFGFLLVCGAGVVINYLARFFYDEDSDRRFVYIEESNNKVAIRRRD